MSRSNSSLSPFAYHAQAIGFSASLTKPCCENVPGQAATSLSDTGGESYSVVRDFNFKGIFSFDEASSYVTGSEDHDSFNTLATVTVRGLNIANLITADQIIARVSSRHDRNADGTIGEGQITLEGSSFRGLQIAGRRVQVKVNAGACARLSFDAARTFVQSRRGHCGSLPSASCSIADIVDAEDLKFADGKLQIEEFGTIYLATATFKPGYQRISMLRAELGCPIAGTVGVAGGEGNGTEIWG